MVGLLSGQYPEINAHSLYTHVWMRLAGTSLEDAVEKVLGEHKISSGRFLVLQLLELRQTGVKPSELATSLGVTQATITGLINGLEQTGYVRRQDCIDDGRACVVELTPEGAVFIKEVRVKFHTWLDSKIYSALNQDEQRQLIHLLEKLMNNIRPQGYKARPPLSN